MILQLVFLSSTLISQGWAWGWQVNNWQPQGGYAEPKVRDCDADFPLPMIQLESETSLSAWLLKYFPAPTNWDHERRALGDAVVRRLIETNRTHEILDILGDKSNPPEWESAMTALAGYYYRNPVELKLDADFIRKSSEAIVGFCVRNNQYNLISVILGRFPNQQVVAFLEAVIRVFQQEDISKAKQLAIIESSRLVERLGSSGNAQALLKFYREVSFPLLLAEPSLWASSLRWATTCLMRPGDFPQLQMSLVREEAFFQLSLVLPALEDEVSKDWIVSYFTASLTAEQKAEGLKSAIQNNFNRLRFLAQELMIRESDEVFDELLKSYSIEMNPDHPLFEAFFSRKTLSPDSQSVIRGWMNEKQKPSFLRLYQRIQIWGSEAADLLADLMAFNESDYRDEKMKAIGKIIADHPLPFRSLWTQQKWSRLQAEIALEGICAYEGSLNPVLIQEILKFLENPKGLIDLKKERSVYNRAVEFLTLKFSSLSETEVTEVLRISKIVFDLESDAASDEILIPLLQKLDLSFNSEDEMRAPELREMIKEMQ